MTLSRRLLPCVVALLAAGQLPAVAATRSVTVTDDGFWPGSLRVEAGTRVVWRFDARRGHNVTVDTGPAYFASPTLSYGSFGRTLRKRGTYVLYCSIHDFEMTVRVTRRAASP